MHQKMGDLPARPSAQAGGPVGSAHRETSSFCFLRVVVLVVVVVGVVIRAVVTDVVDIAMAVVVGAVVLVVVAVVDVLAIV